MKTIRIVLDGKDVGVVEGVDPGRDFGTETFSTRAGHHHVAALDDASGEVLEEFDYDNGWHDDTVFAPLAADHDVCLGIVTTIYSNYSSSGSAPAPYPLTHDIEQIDPPDQVFEPSPASIQTKSDSEKRVALRAIRCGAPLD